MDYQSLYHLMFNAVTDALERMERGDWAEARRALIEAQQRAEKNIWKRKNEKPAASGEAAGFL